MNIKDVQRRSADDKPDWTLPAAVVLVAAVVSAWVVWIVWAG